MVQAYRSWVVAMVLAVTGGIAWGEDALHSRPFIFHYAATVQGLPPAAKVRVWLPVATSDAHQDVKLLDKPDDALMAKEERYGNAMVYLERTASDQGEVDVALTYDVKRMADRGEAASTELDATYLRPDVKVPVGGASMKLLAGKPLAPEPLALAHQLYDVVFDHMQYRKDKPGWGTGDANWACESGYGNCTDFHSLFMALCRGKGIPAKFEIGFMIPAAKEGKVAGYHCWAQCKPAGSGWIPVDISDASEHPDKRGKTFGALDENRVMFTTGRDLQLVPQQAGGPVNFFIYPYVEVDGKQWPQDKIAKHFSYQDQGVAR